MSLPIHQRRTPDFHGVFERTAQETIASMNALGRDIANQPASQPLALQRMGVVRKAVPVIVRDPFGGESPVHLSCRVELTVSVPAERRGIHVSRIGDVLARLTKPVYGSLQDYAVRLTEELRTTQHSHEARVRVEGDLSYLEENVGVKTKQSLETLGISAEVDSVAGRLTFTQGIAFSHITACPCVQETYRQSHAESSSGFLRDIDLKRMPFMTHSQRCRTQLWLSGLKHPVDTTRLLAAIDDVAIRSRNTMPRELELMTVYQAHAKPQFLEDLLRDLVASVYPLLGGEPPGTKLRIDSVSMESIHDFDLHGGIECDLAELHQVFGK